MASKLGTWLNAPIKGMPEMKGMFGIQGNSVAGMGIGALGSAVGQIGSNLIGGGLESGVGSGITNIGGAIGSAVGMVNPVLGGIISAGSGIVGGITSAMFGSKLNKENIARINSVNNAMNILQVDDSTNNSVADAFGTVDFGSSFTRKDVGKDGWFSNKAKNKFKVLTAQRAAAINRANATLLNAAENADTTMDQEIMANFAANGGQLKRNVNLFPTGGFLSTQGGDFFTGITEINAGGTHEKNPNGGVQVGVDPEGTPNLVEEGEVIWDGYVFSNRIKVPKKVRERYKLGTTKDLTFADAVKYVARESKERPNDPISANGLIDSMQNLQQEQETIREAMQAKELAKTLKKLPKEEKMQLLQGMIQGAEQQASEMQGIPQMQGMPMNPSMGIPQDAPIMQAYGGRKTSRGNVFDIAGEMSRFDPAVHGRLMDSYAGSGNGTLLFNNTGFNSTNVYAPTSRYRKSVDFINANRTDPRVTAWRDNWLIPAINYYNRNNPNYTQLTPENFSWDAHYNFSLDGNRGGHHLGNNFLDEILDWDPTTQTVSWKAPASPVVGQPASQKEAAVASPVTQARRDYYIKPDGSLELMPQYWEGRAEQGFKIEDVDYSGKTYDEVFGSGMGRVYKDSTKRDPVDGVQYTDHYWGVAPASTDPSKSELGHYPTWLRYAEPIGQLGLVLTDAFGLTNKPDTDDIDAAVNAIQTSGAYQPITFNPIGDYRRYRPLDRDYYLNKLNAEAGATRRDIMNVSGGNRGAAIAGLLSADYNTQQSIGDTLMKQELDNRQHEGEVAEFNRDTNQFNATGIFDADKANQQAMQNARSIQLNAILEGAKYKATAKAQAAQSRGLNIAGLFSSLGQIGLEAQNRKDRDMLIRHDVLRGLFPDELKGTVGKDAALAMLIEKGYTETQASNIIYSNGLQIWQTIHQL